MCQAETTPQADSIAVLGNQLRANDEKLLTAAHRGDRATWEAFTTPDFVYVEEGTLIKRDRFLQDLQEDDSQPLIISYHEVTQMGDTALVIHRDDIPAASQSSRPGGQYLTTETWQKLNGRWKLRIVHIDAIHTDPPAVLLTPSQLAELEGCYRSGTRTMTLHRHDDRLWSTRTDAPQTELKAETRDVFYTPGQPRMRLIFQRDANGAVSALIRRDENSDRIWTRVGCQ